MFCPNCGEKLPDGSKFCGACGKQVAGVVNEFTENMESEKEKEHAEVIEVPTTAEQKKKKPAKAMIGIVIVVAVIAVAFGVFKIGIFPTASKNSNAYVYIADGRYELLTNIKKGNAIEIESTKGGDDAIGSLVSFSSDGKYVYYYTKFDQDDYSGTLCKAEYDKLKENTAQNDKYIEVISSNVNIGFETLDDGTLMYEKNDDLYYYNGTDSVRIAKSVSRYYLDKSGRVAYEKWDGDNQENKELYGVVLDNPDNAMLLAKDYLYVIDTDDLDNIYYYDEFDEDYNETLYVTGFGKDAEKIGENVLTIGNVDNAEYVLAPNGSKISLYDYVEDEAAEQDAGIKKPDLEDYATPEYSYDQIDSDDVVSAGDEIYTSCSQYTDFWGSPATTVNEYGDYSDVEAFVRTYRDRENEDGYFLVDAEIENQLKAFAEKYGQHYQGEWHGFCFRKEESGTTYDYDAYDAACKTYSEAEDRILLREELKSEENEITLYNVCKYDKGEIATLYENVITVRTSSEDNTGGFVIMFYTPDLITDKKSLGELLDGDGVDDLKKLDFTKQSYFYSVETGETYQLSAEVSEYFNDLFVDVTDFDFFIKGSKFYANLYFENSENEDEEDSSAFFVADISNGMIDNMNMIAEDGMIYGYDDENIFYVGNWYTASDHEFYNLYSYNGKESNLLAKDIMDSDIYEDDVIVAYTDGDSTHGYEVTLYDKNGSPTLLADDVTEYIRVDESTLLYISDHDLYVYDGKERSLVKTDVDYIWTSNSMEMKCSY